MSSNIFSSKNSKTIKGHSYNGKRILFANVPADGHFNPLTGLAAYLKSIGYDVRWYTSSVYSKKVTRLNIPFYPFKKAMEVNGENLSEVFPQRDKITNKVKKLNFDMINVFILRSVEYYEDIKQIHQSFPFDLMIADCAFSAVPFIKDKMNIPVITIGVLPLTETSKDLAPTGLGMLPSNSKMGRLKQDVLRFVADKILFREANNVMKGLMKKNGIDAGNSNVFDTVVRKSNLLLQSGTPGFEYKRSDLGKNIRFIGAVLPVNSKREAQWFDEKLYKYYKVILVTQGTIEKDVNKLLVPTFEAFKDTDYLVIATTGGAQTKELREKYPHDNIIIEDFIPFDDIMPYADVYITNGGYGGVMLAIENKLPMVVAGVHEGKNEINARVGYFEIGVNLFTESPIPGMLRKAVYKVINDDTYNLNIRKLSMEFSKYDAAKLCAKYVDEVLTANAGTTSLVNRAIEVLHEEQMFN